MSGLCLCMLASWTVLLLLVPSNQTGEVVEARRCASNCPKKTWVIAIYATPIRMRVSVSEGYGYADTAFSQKTRYGYVLNFYVKK